MAGSREAGHEVTELARLAVSVFKITRQQFQDNVKLIATRQALVVLARVSALKINVCIIYNSYTSIYISQAELIVKLF